MVTSKFVAGEERRGSNASQGVSCCMAAVAEQLGIMGAEKRSIISSFCAGCSTECLRLRLLLSKGQERKKESRGVQRPGRCSEGPPATPCVDLAQLPDARGEGGSSGNHKQFRKDHCLNHQAGVGSRWRMTQTCSLRQEEEKRNSQERDTGT